MISTKNTLLRISSVLAVIGALVAFQNCTPSPSGQATQSNKDSVQEILINNNQLINLSQKLKGDTKNSGEENLLSQLDQAADEHRRLIKSLIKNDPASAIKLALNDDVKSRMPEEVQERLEKNQTVEGIIESIHSDSTDGKNDEYEFYLSTENGHKISLNFATKSQIPQSGTQVRAHGPILTGERGEFGENNSTGVMALGDTSLEGGLEILAVPSGAAFGEKKTLVILINFADLPDYRPWTKEEIKNVIIDQANSFYLENSYGQTWITGEVTDWLQVSYDSTNTNYSAISSEATEILKQRGYDLSQYKRTAYLMPGWKAGKNYGSIGDGGIWVSSIDFKLIAHEIGHNYTFPHAGALECYNTTWANEGCMFRGARDAFDVMSYQSVAGHINAIFKEKVGWLGYNSSPPIVKVEQDGIYTISALESNDRSAKSLKILKYQNPITQEKIYYYFEYRQPIGFDSFITELTGANAHLGILAHINYNVVDSAQLDMHAGSLTSNYGSDDFNDGALTVGESYTDSYAGFTISTLSIDNNQATVEVKFHRPECLRQKPSISLLPGYSYVNPGVDKEYIAVIANNNNLACPTSVFNITSSASNEFIAVSNDNSSMSLDSGQKGIVRIKAISPVAFTGSSTNLSVSVTEALSGLNAIGTSYVLFQLPSENLTPVAVNDEITIAPDTKVIINILDNDYDPEGALLNLIPTYSAWSQPLGTAYPIRDYTTYKYTKFEYTPPAGFTGIDYFIYEISDGTLRTRAAVVINVTGGGTEPPPTTGDTLAPTAPSQLSATAQSCSEVSLIWSASADEIGGSGISGYKVYAGSGTLLKQTNTTQTQVNGLLASTSYTYQVSAIDNAGNESAKSSTASVKNPSCPDLTPPNVALISPTSGATASGLTAITASATDNAGVKNVNFYVDGSLIASDSAAPYSTSFDTKTLIDGPHKLSVQAIDTSGNQSAINEVSVNVQNADTTAPTINLTSPADGSVFSPRTTIEISASASDNVAVSSMSVMVNGSLICNQSGSKVSCAYKLAGSKGATYNLEIQATDSSGNIATSRTTFLSTGAAGGSGNSKGGGPK